MPFEDLRGVRIFITGGTGFIGKWLVETLLSANTRLDLGVQAVLLTRDPKSFRARFPHLAGNPAIQLHQGDVRTFKFPEAGFSHVIHGATDASAVLNAKSPLVMFDTIIEGTRRVLDCSVASGARRFLFLSSGAVYGKQPPELSHVPESYMGGPDPTDPLSAYGEGKRCAELLCTAYSRHHGFASTIARCFAFTGPYLPLDAHFAIGNFIKDALVGGPIRIEGDGTPFRSYLYAADLAVWLWTILLRGESCRPYNVGSEVSLSIADLAHEVANTLDPNLAILIAKPAVAGVIPPRYVPSTARALRELGLEQTVALPDAIRRTAAWYGFR